MFFVFCFFLLKHYKKQKGLFSSCATFTRNYFIWYPAKLVLSFTLLFFTYLFQISFILTFFFFYINVIDYLSVSPSFSCNKSEREGPIWSRPIKFHLLLSILLSLFYAHLFLQFDYIFSHTLASLSYLRMGVKESNEKRRRRHIL